MVSNLSEHIIVCGFGRVGKKVSSELRAEGIPFIVLDDDEQRFAHAQEYGYLAMKGNAANEGVLHQVGIDSARGLVSAVDSDAENVFIVLTARGLNPTLNIVARANYEDSEPKLLRAGANRTLVPYHIGGKRLVTMLLRPSVADFLDEVSHASGMEFLIEEIPVGESSPLAGKTIAQSQIRNLLGVAVLAYRDVNGKFNTHPNSETLIEANGLLLAIGTRDQLRDLMKFARGE